MKIIEQVSEQLLNGDSDTSCCCTSVSEHNTERRVVLILYLK